MTSRTLSPSLAAILANGIYTIVGEDQQALKGFLSLPVFSSGPQGQKSLQAAVGGRLIRTAKDGFGLAAMGAGPFQDDLFLIFRGTTNRNSGADFLTDARIGVVNSKHIGFSHAFQSMRNDLHQFVRDKPIKSVHCVGHSLGGAVATLAAEWAHDYVCPRVQLYTFGQPRVGLGMFPSFFTLKIGAANIHRVFHSTDPVPMVPIYPYVHCPLPGAGHRINSAQKIHTAKAHSMDEYEISVVKKHWEDLERAFASYNYENAIEEWLQSKVHENIDCPKTFEWLEQGLIWLIKKALAGLVGGLQLALMGVHTFLDTMAYILAKGIELKDKAGYWVKLFMEKMMRILGIPVVKAGQNPTRNFFRFLLETLAKRAYELAQRAIRAL